LNVGAKIFTHIIVVFTQLGGILRVLILAIPFPLIWTKNLAQAWQSYALLLVHSILLNQGLSEPVSIVLDQRLNLRVPENARCTMGQPGIQGLMHKWLELLND